MMRNILTAIIFITFTAACSSVNVKQDYDPSTNFSRLRTYAWQSDAQKETSNVLANNSLIDSRIRNAVNSSLIAQGYREVEKKKADFLVTYHYRIDEKTETRDKVRTGIGFGTGSRGTFSSIGISFGAGEREYEQGTLVVDLIDPKTEKLYWRGFTRQRLIWQSDPKKSTTKINKTVEAILKEFPPKK